MSRGLHLESQHLRKGLGKKRGPNYPTANFYFPCRAPGKVTAEISCINCVILNQSGVCNTPVLGNGTAMFQYCVQSCCPPCQQYMNKAEEFRRETVGITEKAGKYLKEYSVLSLKELRLHRSLWI